MGAYTGKEVNITAEQWTGVNLAAVQVVCPDAFVRDGSLYFPSNHDPYSNVKAPIQSWLYFVDTTPTFIYVLPPQAFAARFEPAP